MSNKINNTVPDLDEAANAIECVAFELTDLVESGQFDPGQELCSETYQRYPAALPGYGSEGPVTECRHYRCWKCRKAASSQARKGNGCVSRQRNGALAPFFLPAPWLLPDHTTASFTWEDPGSHDWWQVPANVAKRVKPWNVLFRAGCRQAAFRHRTAKADAGGRLARAEDCRSRDADVAQLLSATAASGRLFARLNGRNGAHCRLAGIGPVADRQQPGA